MLFDWKIAFSLSRDWSQDSSGPESELWFIVNKLCVVCYNADNTRVSFAEAETSRAVGRTPWPVVTTGHPHDTRTRCPVNDGNALLTQCIICVNRKVLLSEDKIGLVF